jgi:5-formyltetrahydrofolate cyclo-ligase
VPVADEKRALRSEMRSRRAALSGGARQAANDQLTERVIASTEWSAATTVMVFVGVKTEPDTAALRSIGAVEGRTILLPRVVGQDIVALADAGRFEVSAFGIPEPVGGEPVDPHTIDLIIVPGLAFDPTGHRLGYGAGFYDRFLPKTGACAIGIGFDCQVVDAVPHDEHDVALHGVITDLRRLR